MLRYRSGFGGETSNGLKGCLPPAEADEAKLSASFSTKAPRKPPNQEGQESQPSFLRIEDGLQDLQARVF